MSAVAHTLTLPFSIKLKIEKFSRYWDYIQVNKNLVIKPF
nr:MAG TPA: hypothetical protein [Caudoviricetes sp.]